MLKHLKSIKNFLIQEFSSLRLAITLFIFLAVSTLIGTILPEEPMVGRTKLLEQYGKENYLLLKGLGFTDVFHSWWYLALLTMFGVNLITASVRRVFPKWYLAFSLPVELKTESIVKLPVSCNIDVNGNGKTLLLHIEKKLKEKKFKTILSENMLRAVKGAWHRIGASVTHVGILTLLFGCAISVLTGFNGMAQVSENEGFYLADLGGRTDQIKSIETNNWIAPISKMPVWFGMIPPHLVKVNKTWRENYENGAPKQWHSDLSVFDENKTEVARKVIHVNDPLEFMGLDIYQSNWGKFLEATFNNQNVSLPVETINDNDTVLLPLSNDIGLKFKILQDINNENKKMDLVEVYSVSPRLEKEKLLGKINKGNMLQIGPINIGYYGTVTYTGLQFKSNPGYFLIYPGLFFIILGVFIAFGAKKQIWVQLVPESNKIIIGGKSDRAKGYFAREFEEIISEVVNLR
jgi:cytochrome c biogenesis protein